MSSSVIRNATRGGVSVAMIGLLAIAAGCKESSVPASKNEAQTTVTGEPSTQVVQQQAPATDQTVSQGTDAQVVQQGQDQTGSVQSGQQVVGTQTPVTENSVTETPASKTPVSKTPVVKPVTKQRVKTGGTVVGEASKQVQTQAVAVDVTVPAGTQLVGTLQTPVSTTDSKVGDKVSVRLEEAVRVGERTVFDVGSTVQGSVSQVASAGRVAGASELTMQFDSVVLANGKTISVACTPVSMRRDGDGKQSAAEIGGGAVAGGVLGRVIGGKKSTLKGAAVGAAVGTGIAMAKKGEQIVLPVGTSVSVTLSAPVVIPAKASTL